MRLSVKLYNISLRWFYHIRKATIYSAWPFASNKNETKSTTNQNKNNVFQGYRTEVTVYVRTMRLFTIFSLNVVFYEYIQANILTMGIILYGKHG